MSPRRSRLPRSFKLSLGFVTWDARNGFACTVGNAWSQCSQLVYEERLEILINVYLRIGIYRIYQNPLLSVVRKRVWNAFWSI
jgi:hypothetical protein